MNQLSITLSKDALTTILNYSQKHNNASNSFNFGTQSIVTDEQLETEIKSILHVNHNIQHNPLSLSNVGGRISVSDVSILLDVSDEEGGILRKFIQKLSVDSKEHVFMDSNENEDHVVNSIIYISNQQPFLSHSYECWKDWN